MESKGQILLEYVMMVAVVFIVVFMVASFIDESQEVGLAMAAARIGATLGANLDSMAIYPDQSFSTTPPKIRDCFYHPGLRL
ncbi:MAG: hypothetical protein Q8N08_07845 [Methanobacteriaceae archaeon]|nr:hypothetical protein [Methanobacteriaceae archaeon]